MGDPLPVIVNRSGGTAQSAGGALAEQVEAAFLAAGRAIDLKLVAGGQIEREVKKAADRGTVVVGGGDGTLGTAAAIISKADATLGILALGTHNHFARQLGIPTDLKEAAALIASGKPIRIDLSEAGGHVFINNASIGLYPRHVRLREQHQERLGVPKWAANIPAAWLTLRRLRHHRLRLRLDGAPETIRTPLLFIGNNIYSLEPGSLGERKTMADGKLSVFAVASASRIGLVGFAVRTLIGRGDPEHDFATLGDCKRLTVDAHARSLDVALDGEVMKLKTPVEFRVRAGALNVIAPPQE